MPAPWLGVQLAPSSSVKACGAENYEITVAPFTGKLTVRKL
jgi:hypothetical protein